MDREQTGKLYEAHYMRVFSYAMTLSGNRELADRLNTGLQKYREDAAYYQMKNNYFGKLL